MKLHIQIEIYIPGKICKIYINELDKSAVLNKIYKFYRIGEYSRLY